MQKKLFQNSLNEAEPVQFDDEIANKFNLFGRYYLKYEIIKKSGAPTKNIKKKNQKDFKH